jgi:hypothetical protein
MKKILISILFTALIITKSFASSYYVSATATGTGDGSFTNPWQLQQALNSPPAITNPNDTIWIWLRGGVYTNTFNSQTSFSCFTKGKASAPIIFRNYKNERATIDSDKNYTMAFSLGNCSYTWIWGIEVLNSDTLDRDHRNINRLGNIYCTAENIKFINLIIHDMGSGLDLWKTSSNSEAYGCLIYNIGNNLRNGTNWEGHGHGMYLQNDTVGTKKIHNNIIFSTYGYGMKVWQTTNSDALGNFDIQKNIIFNGGSASENLGGVGNNSRTHNFFVVSNGVNNPIRNTVIKHNYTFSGTNTPRPPVNAFGLNYGVTNMILDSNFITCQTRLGFNNTPVFSASFKGNKIIGGIPAFYGYYLWRFTNADYPQNTFLPLQPISGLDYIIFPNEYDKKLANIAIYNWAGENTVQLNVSNTSMKTGDIYELVNVMDYYNDIITDTLEAHGIITVPMTGHTIAPIIGSNKSPVSQFPEFGSFIIRKIGSLPSTNNISHINENNVINVFPNPNQGLFKAIINVTQPGLYELTLTDINGKVAKLMKTSFFKAGTQEIELDIKNFSDGVYILKIFNQNSTIQGKFMLYK